MGDAIAAIYPKDWDFRTFVSLQNPRLSLPRDNNHEFCNQMKRYHNHKFTAPSAYGSKRGILRQYLILSLGKFLRNQNLVHFFCMEVSFHQNVFQSLVY